MGEYAINRLGPDSFADVLALQEQAFAAYAGRTAWLRRNTPELLAACLQPPHETLGAFAGLDLVAFIVLYVAGTDSENLGYLLGMTEEAELATVANAKLVIVHPDHRRRGLQRTLMRALEATAHERGLALLAATAHPDNAASIRALRSEGYQRIRSFPELYGSGPRDLYAKNIEGPTSHDSH